MGRYGPAELAIKHFSADDLPESIRAGGQETRVKIIRAAAKLFATKTFYGTSIQDIATEAGMSRSNIYYHYKSKEKILADIYVWVLDRGLEMVRAIMMMNKSPLERLGLIIWYIAKAGSIDQWERSLIAIRVDPQGLVSKKDREIILNKIEEATQMMKKLIGDCVDSGSIEKHVDPSVSAQMIFSLINQIAIWYSDEGRFTSDEIADFAVEILINGLRTRNLQERFTKIR